MITLYNTFENDPGQGLSGQTLTMGEARHCLPELLTKYSLLTPAPPCHIEPTVETANQAVGQPTLPGVLWVDFQNAPPEELALLTEIFGYPSLCVEDCHHLQMLPKLEEYPACLFLVVHAVETASPEVKDRFNHHELDLFMAARLLVTVHDKPLQSITHIRKNIKRGTSSVDQGAIALAHELLDTLVDGYAPVLDDIESVLMDLEDHLLAHPNTPVEQRFFTLQRTLLQLRRLSLRHQDVFYWLSHRTIRQVTRTQALQFKDIYDHMARIAELSDAARQILSGILSIHLSMMSNRMNDVMRILTMFSAILLPLTFIVGVYGMNFHFMPELDWPFGYGMVWLIMLAVVFGMLAYFKRKRWW